MLSIRNVSKDMGEFVLKDICLEISEGEYFVLVGPSGAGKTILLETLAGIYHPDKGHIFLGAKDITHLHPRHRNIGMVYQDYMLFPHLNVRENIGFGLQFSKKVRSEIKQKVEGLASLLGISELLHRYPATLSGGERQRTAIARALIVEPQLLLLDEPLSALDNETKEKLKEELKRIHSLTRTTIIHVTHNFDEAFLLGNTMAIINKGVILQVGEPGTVFRKPESKFVANFLGVSNLFRGEAMLKGDGSDVQVNGIKIISSEAKAGQVYVSIRPEDILVSLKPLESSARNSFEGVIENIADAGTVIRITVNVGVPLITAITRRSFDDMNLSTGKSVHLTFKAAAVHVF